MIRLYTLSILCLSALSLQACTLLGVATGAAAITGVSAAQEGGISRAVSDTAIKLKVNEAWFQYNVEAFRKLGTTVNQGRVLVTGVVQNPEHRVEAVRLAWQVPGVTQVINEVRVANSEGITGFVKDRWITSRLRGSITFDRGVQSINYSIDTVQGVVYLMGVAQNQAELNRVTETARTISGVKQVISYVKLAGEPVVADNNATTASATTTSTNYVAQSNTVQQPVSVQPTYNAQPAYNVQPTYNAQPQILDTSQNPIYNVPENYGPIATEPAPVVEEYYHVPAQTVPADSPTISDQYYR